MRTAVAPGKGEPSSRAWRAKQLEYTWLRSLMGCYADFTQVAADALGHEYADLELALPPTRRGRLIEAYVHLAPYPNANAAPPELSGRPPAILPKGSPAMLNPLACNAGLKQPFTAAISVDALKIYKPAPVVPQLAFDRPGMAAGKSALYRQTAGAPAAPNHSAFTCSGSIAPAHRLTRWPQRPTTSSTAWRSFPRCWNKRGAFAGNIARYFSPIAQTVKFCSSCAAPVALKIPPGDNRLRYVCTGCETIHYENPRMVLGTIPEYGDKILLCKRAIEPRYGKWTLPAGFMENGESTEAAAMRETLEEAKAKVELGALFSVMSVPHVNQVHMFYRARLLELDFGPGEESLEVELFDEADIPWTELAFRTISTTLRRYFDDRKTGRFALHSESIAPQHP